jgi:WD40 repeat protein
VEAAGKESAVLKAYIAKITVVKLNKDDSRLVCGDSGFKIKYWNFTSREELTDRWVYHSGKITSLAFSASEDYIVSAGIDNRICVWNTKTLEKEAEIESRNIFLII